MPELPEVEAVARSLRPLVHSQRIGCVHVFHPIVTRPQSAYRFTKSVQGRTIIAVERRGKYLLLILDHGLIEMHFRFDGQLIWFSNAKELLKLVNRDRDGGGVHVDVALELGNGVLGFADARHFGRVHGWESPEACRALRALGIDGLSRRFTAKELHARLSRSKRPVKEFLLDQTKIAGIGNIYACEALWHAGLDPRRRAKTVKGEEVERLHKAIVSVLRRALECCLAPAPDLHDPKWWFQGLEKIVRAYRREGTQCQRCNHTIRRMEQGGRSTYYCPHCQR
jgi:formamidopyrimidine-DNA glycosylase